MKNEIETAIGCKTRRCRPHLVLPFLQMEKLSLGKEVLMTRETDWEIRVRARLSLD